MDENAPPPISTPPSPPPQMAPPPLIVPPPPAPPARRGRGWMVLALVLLVLLGISMLFNAGNFVEGMLHGKTSRYGRTAGPRLDEVVYEDNEAGNKIAI